MEQFDGHINGIDFLVEWEELPGKTAMYVGRPIMQDVDPGLKITVAVYDQDSDWDSEAQKRSVIGILYQYLIEDLFNVARAAKRDGTLDKLLEG